MAYADRGAVGRTRQLGALEAVLSDVAGQSVDVTVNLGDLLSGGL